MTPGTDRLTIEGTKVQARSSEGVQATMDIAEFVARLAPANMSTCGLVIPDGVRMIFSTRSLTVFVWELEPMIHRVRWISEASEIPYKMPGREVLYQDRRLALPYLVILAVFVRDASGRLVLSSSNEAYFRTAPLKDPGDALCFPALLNLSKFPAGIAAGRPLSWICTQYTNLRKLAREQDHNARIRESLKALRSTMLEAGFNYSSEHHELTSYWTVSSKKIPQVADLDRWEQLSREDPLFVLNVPWLPALWRREQMTVQKLVDRIVGLAGGGDPPLDSSAALAHVVFQNGPPPAGDPA